MKEQFVLAVFSEILRRELNRVEADLNRSFADGGDASGARAEKFAEAVKRAQSLSKIAVKGFDLQ